MIPVTLLSICTFASLFAPSLAGLYVNYPLETDSCTGGQSCTVSWLDDGLVPLLTGIGASTIGLYHGEQKLVQTIQPVDVSITHSLQFTPNPQAGPDSDGYYIAFTSVSLKNGSQPYQAFSPHFRLTAMQGSFASPVPSLTQSLPIPSSVASAPENTIESTRTVGSGSGIPTGAFSLPASTSSSPTTSTSSASPSSSSSLGFVTSSSKPSSPTSLSPSPSPSPSTPASAASKPELRFGLIPIVSCFLIAVSLLLA